MIDEGAAYIRAIKELFCGAFYLPLKKKDLAFLLSL